MTDILGPVGTTGTLARLEQRSSSSPGRAGRAAPPVEWAPSPMERAPITVDIESLDYEGRGVARHDGKTVFVEGALPGETVAIETVRRKPTWELARAVKVEKAAADRVAPRCPHFGTCGGCTLQHATPSLQVAAKQRTLEDALARIGRVAPAILLPPLHGPAWGYRTRARLSVRHVPKKGGVLVGFHERKSSYVADMRECHVLPPRVSALLPPLRELVGSLTIRDRLPQIEVAVGVRADDASAELVVLVMGKHRIEHGVQAKRSFRSHVPTILAHDQASRVLRFTMPGVEEDDHIIGIGRLSEKLFHVIADGTP